MAIKFLCPACSQPIEVDPEWGGRQVACPFCRRAVSAPESSTFTPTEAPPVASPASDPPSPDDWPAVAPPPSGGSLNVLAAVALGLAGASFVLFIGFRLAVVPRMWELAGPDATPEEAQEAIFEQISEGSMPVWLMAGGLAVLASVALWGAGLVCGIVARARPAPRGRANAARVVCAGTMVTCSIGPSPPGG